MASLIEAESARLSAYWLVALLCIVTGVVRIRRLRSRRWLEAGFWFGLCVLLIGLAVLKEQGVQVTLGNEARAAARSAGWYGERRVYQALLAGALMATTAFILLIALILMRDSRRSFGLAFIGAGSLVCFVAVRALSLHQTDALLYRRHAFGVQINALLEMSLLLLTALGTVVALASQDQILARPTVRDEVGVRP